MPNRYDQLLAPGESGVMEVAAHAPNAKIVDLDDIAAHSGNSTPRSVTVITAEVQDLLQRIADGRLRLWRASSSAPLVARGSLPGLSIDGRDVVERGRLCCPAVQPTR